MTSVIDRITQHDRINFLLTNRIPRGLATRFMGWFSRIEHPLLCRLSIGVWQRVCGDLALHEAKKSRFTSVHDCFVRELKEGVRPIDSRQDVLISPCDAVVVSAGRVKGSELIQAKGLTYTLEELLVDPALVELHRDSVYVTLRLRSNMYHRFHAPADCSVQEVIYVAGDTWNVNPVALRRIERLYCKNERAVVRTRLRPCGAPLTLVPVAAILVASIQLHFLDERLHLQYQGPTRIPCRASFKKGDELGYFHHGSTIIVLASRDVTLCDHVREGVSIRMGQPLLQRQPR